MTDLPSKIFLIGFMGVGKSHWGKRLSLALNYKFIDLDEEIIQKAGVSSINQLFEEQGEHRFRLLEAAGLQSVCHSSEPSVIACGGGAPCYFDNLQMMKAAGLVIWLKATSAELLPRLIAEKDNRPLIRQLDEASIRSYVEHKMTDRLPYYQQAHRIVLESTLTESDLVQKLLHE
ncbi:MAG: shikimate kinase [Bacteroidota bacterium]|jgi:shikimate kinase